MRKESPTERAERVAEWIVLTQIPFDTASEREEKKRKIQQVLEQEFST